MKFGKTIATFLSGNQERFFAKCPRIEYKKLKRVLRECRTARTSSWTERKCTGDEGTSSAAENRSARCPACERRFFIELSKEVAEIVECFSARVQKLRHRHNAKGLHRHVIRLRRRLSDDDNLPLGREGILLLDYVAMNAIAVRKILKKYDKVHCSVAGRNFKAELQAQRRDLMLSPWLIELGALYLNSFVFDASEPSVFLTELVCELDIPHPVLRLVLSDSNFFECSLICPYCLELLFDPYALGCGHLFCSGCACTTGKVLIRRGPKKAPKTAECPICRKPGVYGDSVHAKELGVHIKNRRTEYWEWRARAQRAESSAQPGTWIHRVRHALHI